MKRYYAEGEFFTSTSQKVAYFVDHLGTVRDTVDVGATALLRFLDTAPYGSIQKEGGSFPLPDFGYAGMFVDFTSGEYLTPARLYAPAEGRFMRRDPLGETAGVNLYAYAHGNPISNVDPNGLQTFMGIGAIPGGGWNNVPTSSIESAYPFNSGLVSVGSAVASANVRTPDYYAATFTTFSNQSPNFGGGGTLIIDRYGNIYTGPAGGLGYPNPAGRSLTAGWLNQSETPTPTQLSNFLSGASYSFGAGYGLGVFESWTPGVGTATNIGITTPTVGVEGSVSSFQANVFGLGSSEPSPQCR